MGTRNRDLSTYYRKTTEQFKLDLLSKNCPVQLIGEYVNAYTKTQFRCTECLNQWHTRPGNILSGHKCPICSEEQRRQQRCLTTDSFRLQLLKVSSVIKHTCELTQVPNALTNFHCNACSHQWSATPRSVLRSKGKCPNCSYKSGYQRLLPSYAYIIRFPTFIKFGITNDPTARLTKHRRHGMIEVVECRKYSNGDIPLAWENQVKKQFGGKYVSKDQLADGWTETLPIDIVDSLVSTMPCTSDNWLSIV